MSSKLTLFIITVDKMGVKTSEVVIGGAGGAAAPPIIETVRGLKGCQPPQKFLGLEGAAPPIFRP